MKKVKFFLLFIPTLIFGQITVPINSTCLETSFSFYRQGKQEQKLVKTYDNEGRILTENSTYSSQMAGNYSDSYTYTYDAQGNNTTLIYKKNGEVKSVVAKEFDTNGNLLKESTSKNNNKVSVTSSISNHTESMKVFYDKDGKTETLKEISTFNSKGDILKKEVINPLGIVLTSDIKTYNLSGKIMKDIHFDATDKITTQTDYIYDGKGNILSDKTLRNNIVFAETKYIYDAENRLVKKIRLNGKSNIDYYFTYENDTSGNITNESYFYNDQKISTLTFEYDSNGNKVKETYFDRNGNINMLKIWEFSCK